MRTRTTLAAAALLVAGALLSSLAIPTTAQEKKPQPGAKSEPAFTPTQLAERAVHRRAVEAVVWGMPAVNYDLMLQEMLRKTKAQVNEVVYWSRPLDWKNQTLTPNPDSIYLMTFFNTKDVGPIVIEIPPAEGGSFAANIDTAWQVALEDAGPEGADKGKGGKYLILPPDYKATVPEGYVPLQSDTYGGFALFRSNLVSHSDVGIAKSVAYGKRVKVYPLSQAAIPGGPPPTKFTDAMDVVFDSTIPYDLRFFQSLDRIVQSEPWIQRDRAMIDPLRSIGIEKGKPFHPDLKTTEILNAAAREAKDWLEQQYDTSLPAYYEGSHWRSPALPEAVQGQSTGYANTQTYPTDARGLTYTYGFIGIKRLGTAQFYLMSIKDKDGHALDGGRNYRLTVPANAPVKQYWSATVYDRATHALIRNMRPASRSSQIQELQKNVDGSVDIYFGPNAPSGKELNWIPTSVDGRFEVLFRLYGPEKPLFDKTWKLPDIEKIQ
jgi:hypothetical protein